MKIGISGNRGSFSEEAAHFYCSKSDIIDYDIDFLIGVENTLAALSEGKIEKSVFPIENSNGGAVLEALYAMANHIFSIEEIFEIDIKHQLHVLPGINAEKIKKIVSHPQALKQCRMYLKRRWEDTELMEYSDTASAAEDLGKGKLESTSAVIAPKICADLYGLEILEENIQDLKFNYTSFIVAVSKS